jgi:FKBP-type peptidyl-prolyl cis-trans isomerase (trigger factor)
VDLLQMGLPQAQVEERMTQMQASVAEEAKRDLKLSFILGKIADERSIEVVDEEINAQVAYMAQQYGQRPERMRHQLEADGTLEQVAMSIRESKVVEQLLTDAAVTEPAADPAVEDKEAPAKKTARKAAKKSGKKASKKAKPEAGEGAEENSQEESGDDSSEK